jgi:hypothetical protein
MLHKAMLISLTSSRLAVEHLLNQSESTECHASHGIIIEISMEKKR